MISYSNQEEIKFLNKDFKHLTLNEIHIIHKLLVKKSFKQIAKEINRSPSTVSRKVRAHIQLKRKGAKLSKYFNKYKFKKLVLKSICVTILIVQVKDVILFTLYLILFKNIIVIEGKGLL